MTSKRLARSTSTLISIVSFLAILAAINLAFLRHYARFDLTDNKLFTISEATRNMLQKMNDDVNVTLYRSEDLPIQLLPDFRFVKEYLEDMAALSGGRLTVSVEIPKDDPEVEENLARRGVMRQQFQVMDRDEYKITVVYNHVLVQHLDKSKVISFPRPTTLEYDLASALLEVTQKEKPVVAFITNDPEFRFQEIFYVMRERMGMGDRFDLRSIALNENQPFTIPSGCKTLVLVKPKNFPESVLYEIDQFVMRGGTLLAFVEAVDFNDPTAMYQPKPPPNVVAMLSQYGLRVNADLVQDFQSHAMRQVPAGRQGIFTLMVDVPYPQWIVAKKENFDTENPALSFLQQLLFPFANSIEFAEDLPEGVQTAALISTTDKATRQTHPPFDLQPPREQVQPPDDTEQFVLAGIVTGPLLSYYHDRDKPESPDEADDDPFQAMQKPDEETPKLDRAANGRVLAISTAGFLNPDILQAVGGPIVQQSLFFVENLIDYLTLGSDLIAIRTKPVQQYPLRGDLTDAEKTKAKFLGRFAVPLLVAVAGIAWWLIRRRRLNQIAQVYAQ